MSFYGFGANGAYDLMNQQLVSASSANLQNALQNVGYGQLAGALHGGIGGIGNPYAQQAQLQQWPQIQQAPGVVMQTITNGISEAPKAVKKVAKRILERLRYEIDDWHGDVLCRKAAA